MSSDRTSSLPTSSPPTPPSSAHHKKEEGTSMESHVTNRGRRIKNRMLVKFLNSYHDNIENNQTKKKFVIVALVLPCLLLSWYAAAIFFTPSSETSDQHALLKKIFLWDEGKLTYDENGRPSVCPRPSICSDGIIQLIMIGVARLTAFTSYVFMAFTFFSKMYFFTRFLSSTYLRKFIPFENLHQVHVRISKIYGGLVLVHVLSHYARYILRRRADLHDQLQSRVHISGFIGIISMLFMITSMTLMKRFERNWFGKFETRYNLHWFAMVVLCISICFHNNRLGIVTSILL